MKIDREGTLPFFGRPHVGYYVRVPIRYRSGIIDHRFPESDGYTILMAASGAGETSGGVKFLLDHGADPNIQAPSGRTALQVAAMNGRYSHVKTLAIAGADTSLVDREGKTAEDYARERGHVEVATYLASGMEPPAN